MPRKAAPLPKFEKVSEWIAAGGLKTGLAVLEWVARQTERAIGFTAQGYKSAGNPQPAIAWFPRSQLQRIENDFYEKGAPVMWLVPQRLYTARCDEGLSF